MKSSTGRFLVPAVLGAAGLSVLFLAGCGKSEAPDPSSPASYMKDTAFRGKLDELRAEQRDLLRARERVVAEMKAKVDAAKARLKTDDEKLVKAELEKDPEWQSLYKRCVDANTALDEQRRKTLGEVRGRIAPKKPISK